MYKSVPPPPSDVASPSDQSCSSPTDGQREHETPSNRPANISQDQWEKFQKLKSRRVEVYGKGKTQRVNMLRKKALHMVNKGLSDADKAILERDGFTLPPEIKRKRKRHSSVNNPSTSAGSLEPGLKSIPLSSAKLSSSSQVETKWNELQQHFDPNPQLKGWDEGCLKEKSGLEEALDVAVERGKLEEAATISDEIANRKFATKIATAFDCVEYVKKKKIEEERKKNKKPSKLKWSFEQKKRWETKGNM